MNVLYTKQSDRDMERYFWRGVDQWGVSVASSLQVLIAYRLKTISFNLLHNRYIGYRYYKTVGLTKAFYTYPINGVTLSKKKIQELSVSLGFNFTSDISISLKKKPFVLVFSTDTLQKATDTVVLMGVYYGKMSIEERLKNKGVIIDRQNTDGYKL